MRRLEDVGTLGGERGGWRGFVGVCALCFVVGVKACDGLAATIYAVVN